ncbi:MAG: hypothetical protein AAGE94_21470 [Acidobacteriota bacterium]
MTRSVDQGRRPASDSSSGRPSVVLGTSLALLSAAMFFAALLAACFFLRRTFPTDPAIAWRPGEPWPSGASNPAVALLDTFAVSWLALAVTLIVLSVGHRLQRGRTATDRRLRGLCLQAGWLFVVGVLAVGLLLFGVLVGGFS